MDQRRLHLQEILAQSGVEKC